MSEEAIKLLKAWRGCIIRETSGVDEMCNSGRCVDCPLNYEQGTMGEQKEALDMAIKVLEQEPRKGEWLRMSDLSEQEDDRYQCSRCNNVVHHKNRIYLYTFNSWCGRCGSDNGRKIEVDI